MAKAIVLLLLCAVVASCAIDVFTGDDVNRAADAIIAQQHKDGTFTDNAQAVQALRSLGKSIPHNEKACTAAKAAFAKATKTVSDIYEASQAVAGLKGCSGVSITTGQKTKLQSALSSGILNDVYDAVFSLIPLADAKLASLADYDFSKVISGVEALAEEDGTFRSESSEEGGNALNAGLALQIVGSVASALPAVAKKSSAEVEKIAALVEKLIRVGGKELDFTLNSDASPLEAASTVLVGLQAIGKAADAIEVTDAEVANLCEQLLESKYVREVAEVYHLACGLCVCADNVIHVPLAIQLSDASPAKLRVRVTNVLDGFATPATVTLTQAANVADSAVVAKEVALTAVGTGADNVEYQVKADNKLKDAAAGLYNVKFTAVPSGKDERVKKVVSVKRVRVTTEVTSIKGGFWLSESAKSVAADEQVVYANYPAGISSALSAAPTQHLYAELALTSATKDFQPSQVFVQLCRATTTKCATFPAAKTDKKDGKFIAKINLGSDEVVKALYGAGDYSIEVLVGDAVLVKPLKWRIGVVNVKYAGDAAKDTHVDPFAPLPDIAHQFRAAEPRPAAFIAYVFSLASLVPIVALLAMLAQFAPKLAIPTEPQEFLSALIFQGSIAAILLSYVWYWFALNIFQALAIAGVLAIAAIWGGNNALRLLNRRRTAKEDKTE